MDESTEREMLSSDAARDFLGVSRTTMHRLVQQGELRGLKVGGQWRFAMSDLRAHLERKPLAIAAKALPELDAELAWWKNRTNSSSDEVEAVLGEAASPEEKISALSNAIVELALERGSSDVHLEPQHEVARLRFRADGVLETVREMPMRVFLPVLNRFKELAGMSVDETRTPQDGRILLSRQSQRFDLRLATCPTTRGESLTIRVFTQAKPIALTALGLRTEQLAQVQQLLGLPNGLILGCGPTGSGKTATFYALLEALQNDAVKIVTVESPVEADLKGVAQTNLQPSANITAASLLRAFLRQDPDIIGIGFSLPDEGTVKAALDAALAGHLVLALVNVASASGAIARLRDLSEEPFLLGDALRGVVLQTLVRRVCDGCAHPVELAPAMAARLAQVAKREGVEVPENARWQRGAGCARCRQSGFRGRIALFEVIEVSDAMRNAISLGADASELDVALRESGSQSLWQVGLERAVNGEIAPEELLRVLAT